MARVADRSPGTSRDRPDRRARHPSARHVWGLVTVGSERRRLRWGSNPSLRALVPTSLASMQPWGLRTLPRRARQPQRHPPRGSVTDLPAHPRAALAKGVGSCEENHRDDVPCSAQPHPPARNPSVSLPLWHPRPPGGKRGSFARKVRRSPRRDGIDSHCSCSHQWTIAGRRGVTIRKFRQAASEKSTYPVRQWTTKASEESRPAQRLQPPHRHAGPK
jgi:hypothetical protein